MAQHSFYCVQETKTLKQNITRVVFFATEQHYVSHITTDTTVGVQGTKGKKKKKDFDNAESELNKINSHSELSVRSDLTYVILFC